MVICGDMEEESEMFSSLMPLLSWIWSGNLNWTGCWVLSVNIFQYRLLQEGCLVSLLISDFPCQPNNRKCFPITTKHQRCFLNKVFHRKGFPKKCFLPETDGA